jgi:outer membrane lipoprotein-sorting protein
MFSVSHRPVLALKSGAVLIVLALALAGPGSGAAPAAKPALPPAEAALLGEATAYLRGLSGAKGRFAQTDPRGTTSPGTFYLQRPGKARFAYDPPSGLVIASDGHTVSVLDSRLKTFQSYPLGLTPLTLFLSRDIRLDKGVLVDKVTRVPGGFTIVARDGHKNAQGRIVLSFTEAPVALTGWTVTDGQGRVTQVRLTDFGPAGPFDPSLFVLRDPKARAPAS